MPFEFFGICGRYNPRPCKLAWASVYHPRIGTYPSDFLPTKRTIWHASCQGGYSFQPPIIAPGESFGLPIIGGLTIGGQFSTQYDIFSPITRVVISFARTANRINVAHVITQAEINSKDASGIANLNVGEYVFEVIAVTDQIEVIDTELTEEQKKALGGKESESDRAFRKLFEQNIPDDRNRFVGIRVNLEGIEYRLDNGGPKAISALSENGQGTFVGSGAARTYRDGSSKIIQVDLKKITSRIPLEPGQPQPPAGSLQAEAREPKAGDVVYLTYVAVREHYIRQSVAVHWSLNAMSLPPQCFSYPVSMKVASFRFYNWTIPGEKATDAPVPLAGWRVVETDYAPVNYNAMMMGDPDPVIGDFLIGGGGGVRTVSYLPGDTTLSKLQTYIADRSKLPTYDVNLSNNTSGDSYHINSGAQGSANAYTRASWYTSRNFSAYTDSNDAQEKILFNVHSKTLRRRDVDKFGIEQYLYSALAQDINSGKNTFFPFMDDPTVNNPTAGCKEYLSNANALFSPIQPLTRWSLGNAETDCAVGGGIQLSFSGFNGQGDVMGVFGIHSNIINERFEKDTRILVEKFGTQGEFGPNIIAIEGLASPRGAVSCIADRTYSTAIVATTNPENLLLFHQFDNGNIFEGMRELDYRPDLPVPPVADNNNPTPDQFERLLGFSGMLGDTPGFKLGRLVNISTFLDGSTLRYKTTSRSTLQNRLPNLVDEQIEEIKVAQDAGKIIIPVSMAYHGNFELEYRYAGIEPTPILLLFKSGGSVEGAVDSLFIAPGTHKLIIDHRWIKSDTIELVGTDVDTYLTVNYLCVSELDVSVANDFLNEQNSSTADDVNLLEKNQLIAGRSVLFQTDVMSIGQDIYGRIFVFFNDRDGGISCAQSNDAGKSWVYHYGIVEPINNIKAEHPFIVHSYKKNIAFMFYLFQGKILCKKIPYTLFMPEDSLLIERFEKDRFVAGTEEELPREKAGLFTTAGKSLRRGEPSYVVAGDLTDATFLQLLGKDTEKGTFEPTEKRVIEGEAPQGQTPPSQELDVRKIPIVLGSTTAFLNRDVDTSHFSGYKTVDGELKLFYLAPADASIGGGNQLQCHVSSDGGINWYDLWEYIENEYFRLRMDSTKKTQFIDWAAEGSQADTIEAADPMESQQSAKFGINIHWSRMKRDKIQTQGETGDITIDSESKVLDVSSPYVFYNDLMHQIFLFYVYNGCLLCKTFGDGIFQEGASRQRLKQVGKLGTDALAGMAYVKDVIERKIRAVFIDGNLSPSDLREELHYYVDEEKKERQVDGNIAYAITGPLDAFDNTRNISAQRVCAYKLPNGNVRLFYKLDSSSMLRAAIWNGSEWHVEEFLKAKGQEFPEVKKISATDVTGGFGENGFGPVKNG